MGKGKELVSFRVTADMLEDLRDLKDEYGSQSNVVRYAINKSLANRALTPVALKYDFLADDEFRVEYQGVHNSDTGNANSLQRIVHRNEGNIDIYELDEGTISEYVDRFLEKDGDMAAASVNPEERKLEYVSWVDRYELPEEIRGKIDELDIDI
jgi:Arc/MetJ-type ribon-helix-helix transcriptional regulator